MTSLQQFYLDRAAQAGRDAAATSLTNVRERHLLAETTWSGLAARAARVRTMQDKLDAQAAIPLPLAAAMPMPVLAPVPLSERS